MQWNTNPGMEPVDITSMSSSHLSSNMSEREAVPKTGKAHKEAEHTSENDVGDFPWLPTDTTSHLEEIFDSDVSQTESTRFGINIGWDAKST